MSIEKDTQKFPKEDDLFFYGAHSYYLWKQNFIKYSQKENPEILRVQISTTQTKTRSHEASSTNEEKSKDISIDDIFPLDKSHYKMRLDFIKSIHGMLYNLGFEKYKEAYFETEASLPPAEIPLFCNYENSSSLVIANNLINLISTASKIESKYVLLSKNNTNLFINGQLKSSKTRVRFLFSAKFISQVIIAMHLSGKNDINFFRSELTTGKPFDYIPYILAEEIFPKDINLTGTSICKKKCYFINISPKICITSRTNGDLIKKIVSRQKLFKDELITDTEFNDIQSKFSENISFEVECNLDYDEENDIVNINFGDEVIIDCWFGSDSVFFSFSNFISVFYILKLFSAEQLSADKSKKELIDLGSFINQRDFFIELDKTIRDCCEKNPNILNKSITLPYYANYQQYSEALSANYYRQDDNLQHNNKYTPSADFFCCSTHNKVLGYYASQIKRKQATQYDDIRDDVAYIIKNKPLVSIRANECLSSLKSNDGKNNRIYSYIIDSNFYSSSYEYLEVIDNVFTLTKNIEHIEYITRTNSRAFYFSVLEAICIFFQYDTGNDFSSISLCNFIETCKQNIIYLDKIKLEQRKKEEEAKLLVRNLRHSINNTSEAVLANLKEAIEIVNKKGADNQNTLNHLYSCNDEVAALRNTVLKFCHDIIDQDSISNLYYDSYTVGYGDKTVTIKEILLSSLFMAIKQLIKNIRFKAIRETYQKEKNISLKDDLLFTKFKDYIELKYHRSFAELTFEEMLSDNTLYKDYSSYVFKVAASSDFDNLYNVFVQKRDFKSIENFLEKYFFSDVNVEYNNADLSIREASYASYLLTDLLNEVCLNTLKYSLPNSSLKVLLSIQDNYLEIKIINETNTNLKGCYGSGTGLSGQQAVVRKIGGFIEKAQDTTTNLFSLTVKLPIHG